MPEQFHIVEEINPIALGANPSRVRRRLTLLLVFPLLIGAIFLALMWWAGVSLKEAFVWFIVPVGPLTLGAYLINRDEAKQLQPRTIKLHGHILEIHSADSVESSHLTELCWFKGSTKDDFQLPYWTPKHAALVLAMPTGQQLACGLDEVTSDQWLNALECNSRKVLKRTGLIGWLVALGMVAIFLTTFAGMLWLGNELNNRPNCGSLVKSLCVYVGLVGGWILSVSPALISGWRRFNKADHQMYKHSATVFALKLGIGLGFWIVNNVALVILVPIAAAFTLHAISTRLFPSIYGEASVTVQDAKTGVSSQAN